MVHPKMGSHLRSLSFRARVLITRTLAWMLDSLVRVSRRAAYDHYASVLAEARTSAGAGRIPPGAITLTRRRATFPEPFSDRPSRRWPARGGVRHA